MGNIDHNDDAVYLFLKEEIINKEEKTSICHLTQCKRWSEKVRHFNVSRRHLSLCPRQIGDYILHCFFYLVMFLRNNFLVILLFYSFLLFLFILSFISVFSLSLLLLFSLICINNGHNVRMLSPIIGVTCWALKPNTRYQKI